MAFGSFSTPSVNTKNIAGYNTPQALFAGVPSSGPGGVTSNVVTSMPIEGMDIQDQIAAYNFAKQQKADREAEWANAAAKNRAAGRIKHNKFPGWRQVNPEEEKLKAAFAEVYAPQLRRTFHDQRMADPGREGEIARRRYGSDVTGGGGYWSSGQNYGNKVQPQGQDEARLRKTLAAMWRAQTDPYLKAVGGGGMSPQAMVSAMQPGQVPQGYGNILGNAREGAYLRGRK